MVKQTSQLYSDKNLRLIYLLIKVKQLISCCFRVIFEATVNDLYSFHVCDDVDLNKNSSYNYLMKYILSSLRLKSAVFS